MNKNTIDLYIDHIDNSIELERRNTSQARMICEKGVSGISNTLFNTALLPITGPISAFPGLSAEQKVDTIRAIRKRILDFIPENYRAAAFNFVVTCLEIPIGSYEDYIREEIKERTQYDKIEKTTEGIMSYLPSKENIPTWVPYSDKLITKETVHDMVPESVVKVQELLTPEKQRIKIIKKWINLVPDKQDFNELVNHYGEDLENENMKYTEKCEPKEMINDTFPPFLQFLIERFQKYTFWKALLGNESLCRLHLILWFMSLSDKDRVYIIFCYDYRGEIPMSYRHEVVKEFFNNKGFLINQLGKPQLNAGDMFNLINKWVKDCKYLRKQWK